MRAQMSWYSVILRVVLAIVIETGGVTEYSLQDLSNLRHTLIIDACRKE